MPDFAFIDIYKPLHEKGEGHFSLFKTEMTVVKPSVNDFDRILNML